MIKLNYFVSGTGRNGTVYMARLLISFFDFTNVKFKPWTDFIIKYLPELNEIDNEIERACYYYVNWNKMIEKYAHIRHKVENQCSDDLLHFLNVDRPENVFDNTKINSWNKRNSDITFGDIPNGSIKKDLIEIAKKYEYRITPIKMI